MLFDDAQQQKTEEPPSYIDAHTHSWLEGDGVIRVRNIFPDAGCIKNLPEFFSIGIHPFNIEEPETARQELATIREVLEKHPQGAVAVGECGLDHFSKCSVPEQEKIFMEQIEISKQYGLPLIIHSVRAWHDIIRIKNEYAEDELWLAHGFRSSHDTAEKLIDHGIMLSFGEAILKDARTRDVLAAIPDDSFVFETDESAVDIREIYSAAAAVREIETEDLRELVAANFNRFRFPESQE